jgi:hypothetical protein
MRAAISKNGVLIRLTHKQWAHIVDSHDYMAGNMDVVMESVEDPDYIVRGWTDEPIALKHYERTSISEKYMVVVNMLNKPWIPYPSQVAGTTTA